MSDVIIVGGGLAGLCAARTLHEHGVSFQLYEAADDVGGRVRTDEVDGFLLDRGFQVLLTAYPEAQRVLDYDTLELQPFYPGAMVRSGGKFHLVGDPVRKPLDLWPTLFNPIGSVVDKVRVGLLRRRLCRMDGKQVFTGDDRSTTDYLEGEGFSPVMTERFFRAFLGGVFLDQDLRTSSRMFRFVFRMFASGPVATPRDGMGAIPAQLCHPLPKDRIHLQARVTQVEPRAIRLAGGRRKERRCVVVATEMDQAGQWIPDVHQRAWSGATCLYFDAPAAPVKKPILVLNGDGTGLINNLHVASQVNPHCAPVGRALILFVDLDSGNGHVFRLAGVRGRSCAWVRLSTTLRCKVLRLTHERPLSRYRRSHEHIGNRGNRIHRRSTGATPVGDGAPGTGAGSRPGPDRWARMGQRCGRFHR